jgi:hypothetical protein
MTEPRAYSKGYSERVRMNDYVGPAIIATVTWHDACTALGSFGEHYLSLLDGSCVKCHAHAGIVYDNERRTQ